MAATKERFVPELFDGSVLIYGQKEACEDEAICCMLAELLHAEHPDGCLLSVDMFGGEHTACSAANQFCLNQVMHTVGPHVTAKQQITDIRFAKLGKDAQKVEARKIRRGQRMRAVQDGTAARLTASALDCLRLARAMHAATVQDNADYNYVLKCYRMAGYLLTKPTPSGLQMLEGPEWTDFSSGALKNSQ